MEFVLFYSRVVDKEENVLIRTEWAVKTFTIGSEEKNGTTSWGFNRVIPKSRLMSIAESVLVEGDLLIRAYIHFKG